MNQIHLTETYKNIYSLPIGMKAISHHLNVGPIHISIKNRKEVYCGRLNVNGVISGLSQLFQEQKLEAGMILTYINHEVDSIQLALEDGFSRDASTGNPLADAPSAKIAWPHSELFTTDNSHRWKFTSTLDVFFVFSLLHKKAGYNYCGAFNRDYLDKTEYFSRIPTASTNPDAVLQHIDSERYFIAKFEVHSSNYKNNFTANDVDVLVVWLDNEKDRSRLPRHVVELSKIVNNAASLPHR